MNNFLFAFLLLFLVSEISAQEEPVKSKKHKSSVKVAVTWGSDFQSTKGEYVQNVVYDDGEFTYATVYTLTDKHATFINLTPSVVKFDRDMKQISKRDFTTDDKNIHYQGTYYLRGRIILLSSKYDSETGILELFAQKYDTQLDPDGERIDLWKMAGKKRTYYSFAFSFSEDSGKFCVTLCPEQKKSENKIYSLKVFGRHLNEIFEKDIEMGIPSKLIEIKNMLVDTIGNAFILMKIVDDKNEKSGHGPDYKYQLIKYSKDGSEEKIKIDLQGKFVMDISTIIDHHGNVRLFNAYSVTRHSDIDGFRYTTINSSTGETISLVNYPITAELSDRVKKIQNDRFGNRPPGISDYFTITDFKSVADGSTYTILEKNKTYTDPGYIFYSEGMIVLKADSSGNVEWCNFIPKIQLYSENTIYLYHTVMYFNNKLYILYNDELDNEYYDITNSVRAPVPFGSVKEFDLMMVEFNDDGKMIRTTVGSTATLGTNVNIEYSKQISPTEMFFYGISMNALGRKQVIKLGFAIFE